MSRMSKTIEDYLSADGWSSSAFIEHARAIFGDREFMSKVQVQVGRTCIYIRAGEKLVKLYVHYQGKPRNVMTVTNDKGVPLKELNCTSGTEAIMKAICDGLELS